MNIIQISKKFPTDIDAINYFESYRWKDGRICPYCKKEHKGNRSKDNRFKCSKCKKSFSVKTGTYLHDTRLPLKKWLFMFSIITDAKKGLSALQLQRNLDISYPTAFNCYHKIREIMTIENKEVKLEGILEQDETFVGGKPRPMPNTDCLEPKERKELDKKIEEYEKEGFDFETKEKRYVACDKDIKRGRGSQKKIPVVGLVQRDGNVVAEVMRKLSYKELKQLVKKHVDNIDDSLLITDEYKGYSQFGKIIEHIKIEHTEMYSYRGINTNTIESFWAFIKRQIMGQHHHVSPEKLHLYVAETVFKFNNRKDDDMFETLVRLSMTSKKNN
ncbi:MAG: IS1595 family transposase [Bacteroidales bacterium]|nr:IS1595 family transposase [Bacteroidales bacterium]